MKTTWSLFVGIWLAVMAACPDASEGMDDLPALNAKVVEFARARLGKKVGDGLCITLAIEALEQAGARQPSLDDPSGDYAWGRRVADVKDALPGDLLQFRNAAFLGKKWVTKRRWISWSATYPHHTAIVSGVKDGGKTLTVLHQNVGGTGPSDTAEKVVREDILRMDSLQPGGWVRVYRPLGPAADDR